MPKKKTTTTKPQRVSLIPTIKQTVKKKGSMSKQGMGHVAGSPFSIHGNSALTKGASFKKHASYDITQTPAQFYSPELTPETWLLPKSRLEILKWVRVFFNLDPYIQSILLMHAQYPICDFKLQYKDKDVSDFFNQQIFNNPEFSWIDFLEQLMLSYWKFGEAIVWGDWNPVKGAWNSFSLVDPSLVEYQENPTTGKVVMELKPTEELKQMVVKQLEEGRTELPPAFIQCVMENEDIPLDAEGTEPNYLTGRKYSPPKAFMFIRKTDPGAVRGTPPIQCLFKDLIYKDKIRLAQIAIADRFHLPIEIWTIGQYTGDPKTSIIPNDEDLAEFRNLIQAATMQPPFSIYLPPYVKYEAIGVNGKLLSVYEDLGYVENSIFVGLGVNKNLIMGSGPSFSSSKQVSLFKLIKMYKVLRAKLDAFIKRYILLPIARANDLKDENGQWIIPSIIWSESLQPEQDKEIFDAFSKLHDKGLVSTKSLLERFMVPIDYDLEEKRLKEEVGSIWDNRKRIAGGKLSGGSEGTDKAPGTPSKPGAGPEGSGTDDKSYLKPPMDGNPDSLSPEQQETMKAETPAEGGNESAPTEAPAQ